MSWTTASDLKAQVQKLWDRGLLLAALAGGELLFPRRLTLKEPGSRDLSERFPEVRDWIADLSAASGLYRLEWRSVNHRVVGANELPACVWVDTLADALGMIGKRRAADRFAELVACTREKQPAWVPWLARRPLRALQLSEDWPRLLAIADWLRRHPRPALYLRQLDLPGVHTKWIEGHRGVLAELLDLALPKDAVADAFTGLNGFCRRYGFLDKPLRVRFRVLDRHIRLLAAEGDQDITLTETAFASLDLPVCNVFMTENEINFLSFPATPAAIVVFGAGYGFASLAAAQWMQKKHIHYWGDIDTHGFAILNELRGLFPHAASLLMDRHTLLAHRTLWGEESEPRTAHLQRLTAAESTLYDQLRQNDYGDRVRLEQERIGFAFLQDALRRLSDAPTGAES